VKLGKDRGCLILAAEQRLSPFFIKKTFLEAEIVKICGDLEILEIGENQFAIRFLV